MSEAVRQSWHPKLTPYRLLVLSTTVAVGTAKAVVSQEGNGNTSTTLEWTYGVVIFLILHFMSTYDDSPEDPPAFMGWLFNIDCMDYLWSFLETSLGISRPVYSSKPAEQAPRLVVLVNARLGNHDKNATPVTLYRLLVCFTTALFGLTKATVTYFGYSASANWIDWVLGVLVTSTLYMIGLYESNSIGLWHEFFVADYTIHVQYGSAVLAIALTFLFVVVAFLWMAYFLSFGNKETAFLTLGDKNLADLTPLALLRERLFIACVILFLLLIAAYCMFTGVMGAYSTMHSSGLLSWQSAADRMIGERPIWDAGYSRKLHSSGPRIKIPKTLLAIIAFLLGCAVYLAFWVISIVVNVQELIEIYSTRSHAQSATSGAGVLKAGEENTGQPGQTRGALTVTFLIGAILFQVCGAAVTTFLMRMAARMLYSYSKR